MAEVRGIEPHASTSDAFKAASGDQPDMTSNGGKQRIRTPSPCGDRSLSRTGQTPSLRYFPRDPVSSRVKRTFAVTPSLVSPRPGVAPGFSAYQGGVFDIPQPVWYQFAGSLLVLEMGALVELNHIYRLMRPVRNPFLAIAHGVDREDRTLIPILARSDSNH